MTGFPQPTFIDARGVRLALYEVDGDPGRARPPVILVHGWPEIAWSWKNQIACLAAAGFRVIALDLRGFGRSDAPADVAAYGAAAICADFLAVLDAIGAPRAIFCGHDWGGALVWSMGQLHPERVAGIISLCTPLRPRPPAPPISIIRERFGPNHYFVRFQEPGAAERLFEQDIEKFFRLMFRPPAPRERWAAMMPAAFDIMSRFRDGPAPTGATLLSEDDLAVYIDAYQRSGFHGGVNLYRNVDANWRMMEGRDETVRAPSLFIGAALDMFLPVEASAGMETIVPGLERHVIEDCGHWMMWEKPAEANALIIDWLTRKFSA